MPSTKQTLLFSALLPLALPNQLLAEDHTRDSSDYSNQYAGLMVGALLGLIDVERMIYIDPDAKVPVLKELDPNIPRTRWDLEDYKVDGTGRKQTGGLSGSLQGSIGYDGNTMGDALNIEDSAVFGVDLQLAYEMKNNPGLLWFGTSQYYYTDVPKGYEHLFENYTGGIKINSPLGDKFLFSGEIELEHGDLGSVTSNDITNGILESSRTTIETNLGIRYEFNDSMKLNLRYGNSYYDQSGDDQVDTNENRLRLGFDYKVRDRLNVFGGVTYINRDWDVVDFDSDGFRVDAGVRGTFPCGVNYLFGLNHEWRYYDNSSLRDRRMFGYTVQVDGAINDYNWGVYSNYGFADPNLPGASWLNMADANGKLFGTYLSRQFGDDFVAMLYCYGLLLDADLFDSSDSTNIYSQTGLRVEKKLSRDLTLGGTLGYEHHEFESGSFREKDTSAAASLFIRRNW